MNEALTPGIYKMEFYNLNKPLANSQISLTLSYLCTGDNLFCRIPVCPRVRKVRTTQSAILPNGKVLRLNTVGTASATENIPSRRKAG